MALYTYKSREEAMLPLLNYNGNSNWVRNQMAMLNGMPSVDQTQLYNAIGRTAGEAAGEQNNGSDNFFAKRGRSIENALGTTGASIVSVFDTARENDLIDKRVKDANKSIEDIIKNAGYNSKDEFYDASNKAEKEIFGKYGFDSDEYWNKHASMWSPAKANDKDLRALEATRQDVINRMSQEDADTIRKFDAIQDQLKSQSKTNADIADKAARDWKDYRENSYVGQKINQDRGKFLGSAINTLSTGVDIAGLGANPLSNAIQGGIEGIADELEQGGLENFSWERAGQNALIGATTGAVTGALNKGISNSLAKNGGNLFKGGNALTRGLNNLGSKTAVGRVGSTLATGAARGAVSGAVGGATGAGLQSALNGVDFGQGVQNALQGAVQGAKQGAATGATMAGANMAISKTPGVGKFYNELQNAKTNWDQSGSNFDERLTNTLTSGDSAVGDWLMNKRQSKVLGSAGNLGNRVQDVSGTNSEALNQFLKVRDEYQQENVPLSSPRGQYLNELYTGALDDLKSGAYSDNDLLSMLRSTDNVEAQSLISRALQERSAVADTPTTAKGWLKKAGQRIVEDANKTNLGNRVQDVATNNQSTQTPQFDAWDKLARQSGYQNWNDLEQKFLMANPDYEPTGYDAGAVLTWMDQNPGGWNPNTPTTAIGWAKRAGQRAVEGINNSNLGLKVKDVSSDMPEDIQNMNIRDYNANADEQNNGMTERLKGSLRSSDGRAANMLKNMPGKLGDKYNDWLAEPAQIEEFGPRYTQFSGDPEAARDYLMRRQQGEVPRASYNQSLEDLNGDGFVDYVYGKPGEGEGYRGGYGLAHIQAKHGDEALNRVPSNIENGVAEEQPFGRYYLTNGSNDDLTVVKDYWKSDSKSPSIKKQWLATSYELDNPVSRGTVSSDSSTARTSAGSGEFDTPANSIVTQNNKNVNSNPQTQLYNSLTTGKTSKGAKLRNAEGMRLAQQYGTIDKPTAKATNPPKVFTDLAELGFTKPADVERMAGAMTGSNGEMSALVRNVVQAADPVDTFVGEKSGQTLDDYINLSIQKHGLDGINEGKAVKSQINALMKSLPSHAEGSIDFVDTPESVFKLTQQLDAEAANYRGKSGMNYGTTTPDKLRAAQVMNDVSNLLKNRIYSTSDVRQALTPEVAQNLKAYAPNNKAWADYVDNTVMKMENVKDLRSAQANWVNANKIIDNAYINSMTYGGRVGGNGSPIPLTKRGLAGAILGKTINSGPALRTRAKVLGKAADFADKMSESNTSTAPVNPQVATPAELANVVSDYNPSTQLYNAIGRTEGALAQNTPAQYLADAAQEAEIVVPNTNSSTQLANTGNASTSMYNALAGTPTTATQATTSGLNTGYYQPTGDYWTDIIASAMSRAIDAEDVNAFATLYGMYQDALSNARKTTSNEKDYSNPMNWSSADRTKLLSAQNAMGQIDQLEEAYNQATGGEGGNVIQGWLRSRASDISGGNLDPSASNYNSLSESVGMGIVKNLINLGVTEADAQRYLQYLPALSDTKEQAAQKLATLRSIYQNQINNLYGVYGL